MTKVPAAVVKRLTATVPKFRKILLQAKERDVNESDTVTIVTDMLEEIFGFDKYSDITREFAIQGTYCDLAIKTGKHVDYLVEVKAIGLELKDIHLKQAVNYASREGIKWVVLTNGIIWQIHRVTLDARVVSEELCALDFLELNTKKKEALEVLFLLCKRGLIKDNIDRYYEYKQSINKYAIGALLCSEGVTSVVRRELRRMNPGIKVTIDEIDEMIRTEIIKREIQDSESAKDARKQVAKYFRNRAKERSKTRNRISEIGPVSQDDSESDIA